MLPALAPTAVATAPVTLTGTFTHTVSGGTSTTRESFIGSGTATVSLVADQNFPGSWRVTGLFYSLNHGLPVDRKQLQEQADFRSPCQKSFKVSAILFTRESTTSQLRFAEIAPVRTLHFQSRKLV